MPDISIARLRTFAVESPIGTSLYAAASLMRAAAARDTYGRAVHVMRAWRATDQRLVRSRAASFLRRNLTPDGQLRPLAQNPLLHSFARSPAAQAVREQFAAYDPVDRVRLRFPREGEDPNRQGDLIILKTPDPVSGEKGVLLIKYSEAMERLAAVFEVERLVERYVIVIEPSWWGYQDASFFLFAGSDADVVVQAQARTDFQFLSSHGYGLTPVRVGAGDWIDPAVFTPTSAPREYDVVMVSSWNPFKRHSDLFDALEQLRTREGKVLRTALIGYPSGWTADDIRGMLERRGLTPQCEIYEAVPPSTVADIVARSRLYVLLSRREGANKAMYEAMFCDTPVLAPADHKGINHDHLNEHTGMTFETGALAPALDTALARSSNFSPRQWAVRHTGFEAATARLNEVLRDLAERRRAPWTRPAVAKKNQPNLQYADDADRVRLDAAYDGLAEYLRPV